MLFRSKQIEQKSNKIKTILGNAKDLSMIEDNTYDLTLLFGPMYHLITEEEKLQALKEAKRITKKDGIIMIAYCMNDYAIITHGRMYGYIRVLGADGIRKTAQRAVLAANYLAARVKDFLPIPHPEHPMHEIGRAHV